MKSVQAEQLHFGMLGDDVEGDCVRVPGVGLVKRWQKIKAVSELLDVDRFELYQWCRIEAVRRRRTGEARNSHWLVDIVSAWEHWQRVRGEK